MEDLQQDPLRPKYNVTVTDAPKFDLSQYISNYRGRTVFRRLYLIASCSTVLQEEAARLAVKEAKNGKDVRNYEEAVALLKKATKGGDLLASLEKSWIEKTERTNKAETARLEHELKGYKNNLIKESIRMGNEDLGSHHHAVGNLPQATKAYSHMRDYCTTPSHIASTALRIIAVSIEQANWLAVQSQIHKLRNIQMMPAEAARTSPKTSAATGLYLMGSSDYKEAATAFIATDPALADTYNEVISSNDVAVYGGLCALASMTRGELQARVLENANFRNFLELEPHIRRAISFFCGSKYSQCLEILESYRADYLLDIYLQPHVEDIYNKIRTKSIVQYFQPFSRVTLDSMEKMFRKPSTAAGTSGERTNGTVAGVQKRIEDELIELIESGTLDAKIDLEARVLVAKESNTRAETHEEAMKMIDGFIREARLKILRMNAVNAGLDVKQPLKGKGNWGGGTGDETMAWLNMDDGHLVDTSGGQQAGWNTPARQGNSAMSGKGKQAMGSMGGYQ